MKIRKSNNVINIIKNILYPVLILITALAIWAVISAIKNDPLLYPMPTIVLKDFFFLFASKGFYLIVLRTLLRTLISFLSSFVLAYFFAILATKNPSLHRIISTVVSVLRAAPTVAVILVVYAVMNKYSMALLVGFLIAFPILYSSFYATFNNIKPDILSMIKVYKVKKITALFNVYFLSVADPIFEACRSTLSLTVKVIISAEILTNIASGVGGNIQRAYASFTIESLLAWTFLAILLSFLCEGFVIMLSRIFIRGKACN